MRISRHKIDALIQEATITDMKLGDKTTLVMATLKSGFVIVETSSCINPEDYDHDIGRNVCMQRIENKLWELEGYKCHG